MAFSHEVISSVNAGDGKIEKTNTYTGTKRVSVSESVANGATDPDNTLNLLADVEYRWNSDSYDTFKLTVDVVSIFVTNASGAAATIQIEPLEDATP